MKDETPFNETLLREFILANEPGLYDELRSAYHDLAIRRLPSLRRPEDIETTQSSRLTFNCRVREQALLHRALLLFRGALRALTDGNVYVLALCIRGHLESTAALGYLYSKVLSRIGDDVADDELEQDLCSQILGSKHESLPNAPDPRSIMAQLDSADRVVKDRILGPGEGKGMLRDCYEYLSEFAHPNYHSNSVAMRVDKSSGLLILRYEEPLKSYEFGLVGYLSISGEVFVRLIDLLEGVLTQQSNGESSM